MDPEMSRNFGSAMRWQQGLPPDDDSSDDEDVALAAYGLGLLPHSANEGTSGRYSVTPVMVKHNIRDGWERLKQDFFDHHKVYPDAYFRWMYRMMPRLFRRITDVVVAYIDWFEEKPNAACNIGANPYQKVCAAPKILCTGCTLESLDREFRMSKTLIADSLKYFVRAIVDLYEDTYLRPPDQCDIEVLLATSEQRGFPGMIGSIDCIHWAWEGCPVAWHGEHRSGHKQQPTIILEAVADSNLWFWHAYFGLPGSLNDVNVLHRSPVFDNLAAGRSPPVNFTVNGNSYNMGYYLADGIYLDWATLIKGVPVPLNDKQLPFTMKQSAYRKDMERAFGVLQAKFSTVKGPIKLAQVQDLKYIMRCCVILHNMAIEDEHGLPAPCIHDFNATTPPVLLPTNDPSIEQLIERHNQIESRVVHSNLQEDLMEHVWVKFGDTWSRRDD